jgi:hypothetical protein
LNFGNSNLFRISYFEFRISGLSGLGDRYIASNNFSYAQLFASCPARKEDEKKSE